MAHQDNPLEDPLKQASPRSRMHASLGRAPSRSRGVRSPRAGSAPIEGPLPLEQTPPRSRVRLALDRSPLRSRAPLTRAPAPVHGHLTP
jgi:hypothetical protein